MMYSSFAPPFLETILSGPVEGIEPPLLVYRTNPLPLRNTGIAHIPFVFDCNSKHWGWGIAPPSPLPAIRLAYLGDFPVLHRHRGVPCPLREGTRPDHVERPVSLELVAEHRRFDVIQFLAHRSLQILLRLVATCTQHDRSPV